MIDLKTWKSSAVLAVFLLCFSPQPFSEATEPSMQMSGNTSEKIALHFFWSRYCPHCREAVPFVEYLESQYGWLEVFSYDLVGNQENVDLYIEMAGRLGYTAGSVPGFIFCRQLMVGYAGVEMTGLELERRLVECREKRMDDRNEFDVPLLGRVHYRDFSLPVFTVMIAALDAFNPCAFFVLMFLLSLIANHRSRLRIALIGCVFVFFSGLMYFLFMAAWLNLFLLAEQLAYVTAVAGAVALIVGLINVKDYFFFKRGVTLSIPDSGRPGLFQRMRNLAKMGHWPAMILATAVLAVVANSYELLCTAGLPMVYTRVLTLNALTGHSYYLYLILYNLVYIVPLFLIVALFVATMGSKKLSERQGRLLKLLSGNMMLGLG
ncbi:MAG: hypothetical protein ACU826_12665, partial [Gammaproteobacteria bacterium]